MELLARYNKNMDSQDQIVNGAGAMDAAVPVVDVGVTEQNYFRFWTGGPQRDPQANADSHFQKHIRQQQEFQGRYGNVAEYTAGALAFSRRPNLIEDMQAGGNWGRYSYDEGTGRGEMVVLNGENGKLASYYELRGNVEQVARYIQEKLKCASWMEVRDRLRQPAAPLGAPPPLAPPRPESHPVPERMELGRASSPLPIPGAGMRPAYDDYPDTPTNTPPGGWPPTPPSPRTGF
jgi:hypothetical protein